MTIDEYVATLSEEEKERHKDLIEECRKREGQNRKSSEANREAEARFFEAQEKLRKAAEGLEKLANEISLRLVPKNIFAKA